MIIFVIILISVLNFWIFTLSDEYFIIVVSTILSVIVMAVIVRLGYNIICEIRKNALKVQIKNRILADILIKELEKKEKELEKTIWELVKIEFDLVQLLPKFQSEILEKEIELEFYKMVKKIIEEGIYEIEKIKLIAKNNTKDELSE